MNLVIGVLLLWVGAALLWVAQHGAGATGPWDLYKKILNGLEAGA